MDLPPYYYAYIRGRVSSIILCNICQLFSLNLFDILAYIFILSHYSFLFYPRKSRVVFFYAYGLFNHVFPSSFRSSFSIFFFVGIQLQFCFCSIICHVLMPKDCFFLYIWKNVVVISNEHTVKSNFFH